MLSEEVLRKQAKFLQFNEDAYLVADEQDREAVFRRFKRLTKIRAPKGVDFEEYFSDVMKAFPKPETIPKGVVIRGTNGQMRVPKAAVEEAEIEFVPPAAAVASYAEPKKRGRPRIHPIQEKVKRPRGRPRKHPLPPAVEEELKRAQAFVASPFASDQEEEDEDFLEEQDEQEAEDEEQEQEEEDQKPLVDIRPSSRGNYVEQDGTKVYHEGGDTPPPLAPLIQDGISVGAIHETVKPPNVDDLVGDRPPRTLTDLYARWPILAEDSQFFLRIERTKPKRWQGLDTAGFVGEIRGAFINEKQIQQRFGGNEYKVTLYGPDPRGRSRYDGEDKPVKALTEPITITVPVIPPVLTALPVLEGDLKNMNGLNPFGPQMPMSTPTTTGDAMIHKSTTGFFSDAMKLIREDTTRREAEQSKATSSLIGFMTTSQKTQVEAMQKDAERREAILAEQIKELKEALKAAESSKGTVAAEVAKAKDENSRAFLHFVEKMGPDKEAEIRRLSEYYAVQTDTLRKSHADQLAAMRDRHEADLRRSDERIRDLETSYRQMLEQERSQSRLMLEQERSQWRDREKDLRDQMKEQGENERKMAEARIHDMKERHDQEIKNIERAHERELRSIKEATDVKLTVAESTHKFALQSAQERLEDAKEEAERMREEAEEAKDLTKQLEKAEQQARLLGFEKNEDNAPKTAMERFAATAGAGLAQALGTAQDWVPQLLAQRQQAQAAAAAQPRLPAHMQQQRVVRPQGPQPQRPGPQPQQAGGPPQPQQVQPPRPSRSAQWAAEGVRVVPRGVQTPTQPLGFQVEEPTERPSQAPEAAIKATPEVQPQPEAQDVQSSIEAIPLPPKVLEYFPREVILSFLGQAENAVNMQADPAGFASLMAQSDGGKILVEKFTVDEIVEMVSGLSESSILVRREGRKWLDRLWSALKKEIAAQTA